MKFRLKGTIEKKISFLNIESLFLTNPSLILQLGKGYMDSGEIWQLEDVFGVRALKYYCKLSVQL